ncbi:hypothetical protein PC123_g7241 [Phytophthora cactorum]|nr:hypothetical protein PC123_g7241 [Phytophthora cactorum]
MFTSDESATVGSPEECNVAQATRNIAVLVTDIVVATMTHNGAPVADGLREVCDRDYYIGCCGYTDGNTVGWSTLVPPVPNVWKATESNYTSGGLMYWW